MDGEENAFMLSVGANSSFEPNVVDEIFAKANPDDLILVQYEMSNISYILRKAKEKGLMTVLNPAPIPPKVDSATWLKEYPADILILNYAEALMILENFSLDTTAFKKDDLDAMREAMCIILDALNLKGIVLTCGQFGSSGLFKKDMSFVHCPAVCCGSIVDTTGAGDTFLGYLLTELAQNDFDLSCLKSALHKANTAASIAISRKGNLKAIPTAADVEKFIS